MKGLLLTSPSLAVMESKLLYLLLLRTGNYSFLPDLYDAVDNDNNVMIKLLSLFAGQKIVFPTADRIATSIRDIKIYYRLKGLTGRDFTSAVDELSADYDIADYEIRHMFRKMKGVVEDAGITTRHRHVR